MSRGSTGALGWTGRGGEFVFRQCPGPGALIYETASSEVRGEGREPLEDKAGELTLLSRSGGEKGLR